MMYIEHFAKRAEPPNTSIYSPPAEREVSHLKATRDGAKVT